MKIRQTLDALSYPAIENILMASPAQLLANQANANLSTGPVTHEGKARASQNATTFGLFSASSFVRPDEQEIYEQFRADWLDRLHPDGPVEEAIVSELVQSAWRLRRCTLLETTAYDASTTAEVLDHMQASIDRARIAAQRALQRNLNELRRLQTERRMRNVVPYGHYAHDEFGVASVKDYEDFVAVLRRHYPMEVLRESPAFDHTRDSAKQSQSQPEPSDFAERSQFAPRSTPRNAPCPCESGEKYKRCCGKNAPPVLSCAA